ncbi:MAG: RecD-like DNA helicase YrrC [uncultured Thermomicrobiales bacterium]|uniref:RecD-like DNA helicase YrrC n=1 Tax=uncultured Thermomicrobiales bacterium TaxID=1645740 RepID=A0A6J4URB9_9BACT|nr:MAG: RecD-like DNA helicase YrrC [uncultured Thermomicrobiales bacterium]
MPFHTPRPTTRAALVALMVLGLLGSLPGLTRAQSTETSYLNEEYGWSLEWDGEVWAPFTPRSASVDLALRDDGDGGDSRLYFLSTDAWGTPADCIEGRRAEIEDEAGVDDVAQVEESGDDETSATAIFTLTYTDPDQADAEPLDRVNAVTCFALVPGEAVLSVTHITAGDAYADEAGAVEDLLSDLVIPEAEETATPDGDATEAPDDTTGSPTADDSGQATETPDDDATGTAEADIDGAESDATAAAEETQTAEAEESNPETPDDTGDAPDPEEGVEGNTYTSPTYGFSLEWDPEVWDLDLQRARFAGRDTLVLNAIDFVGYLYVEAYDAYDGDPADCLEGSSEEITADDAAEDVEPFEDEDGEPVAGEEDGVAFAAYTLTSGGTDAAAYFDCQTLVEGEAVLAFSLLVAIEDAEAGFEAVADLREGLDLSTVGEAGTGDDAIGTPEDGVPEETDGDATETAEADATETPEDEETTEGGDLAGVDGNAYESPTFGYTLEWDEEIWMVESATSDDEADTLVLTGENSLVTITAYAGFDGDAAACVEAAQEEIAGRDGVSEVTILEDDDGVPIAEGDEEYSYAYYGYTLDDGGDSEDYYEYVECSSLGDGEAVLQISQAASLRVSDQELDALEAVLATFEFGDDEPVL